MKYAVYRDKIISEQRTIMQKHEQYGVAELSNSLFTKNNALDEK